MTNNYSPFKFLSKTDEDFEFNATTHSKYKSTELQSVCTIVLKVSSEPLLTQPKPRVAHCP